MAESKITRPKTAVNVGLEPFDPSEIGAQDALVELTELPKATFNDSVAMIHIQCHGATFREIHPLAVAAADELPPCVVWFHEVTPDADFVAQEEFMGVTGFALTMMKASLRTAISRAKSTATAPASFYAQITAKIREMVVGEPDERKVAVTLKVGDKTARMSTDAGSCPQRKPRAKKA